MTTTTLNALPLDTLVDGNVDQVLPMYIDGGWAAAADGGTYDSYDPATGEPWAQVAEAGPEDVDRAVAAARAAIDGPWGGTNAPDRARLLWRMAEIIDSNRDLLARIESRDNGKALRETRAELDMIVRYFEFFSGVCQNVLGHTMPDAGPYFTYTRREPVGVVGAIIPWNSPLNMLAWKVCPALAGGNTVVLKPADETPVSALVFAALTEALELPPGVLNILPGIGARAGEAIVDHPGVDKLAFTGSTATGKRIAARAASTMKLATFELGGKSPNIVFADADLELAVQRTAYGIFSAAGPVVHGRVAHARAPRRPRASSSARLGEKRVGDPRRRPARRPHPGRGADVQAAARQDRAVRRHRQRRGGADRGGRAPARGRARPRLVLLADRARRRRQRHARRARGDLRPGHRGDRVRRRGRGGPRSPTTRPTGSPARSGRATSSAPTASPTGCERGPCGSTTTAYGTG